jgi:hypothetical protein
MRVRYRLPGSLVSALKDHVTRAHTIDRDAGPRQRELSASRFESCGPYSSLEAVYEAVHWLIQTGRSGCRSDHN